MSRACLFEALDACDFDVRGGSGGHTREQPKRSREFTDLHGQTQGYTWMD